MSVLRENFLQLLSRSAYTGRTGVFSWKDVFKIRSVSVKVFMRKVFLPDEGQLQKSYSELFVVPEKLDYDSYDFYDNISDIIKAIEMLKGDSLIVAQLYMSGINVEEMADVLELPVKSVKSKIHRVKIEIIENLSSLQK